jgi:hypothetical protein
MRSSSAFGPSNNVRSRPIREFRKLTAYFGKNLLIASGLTVNNISPAFVG